MIRISGSISRLFRIVWLGLLPSFGLASALLLPAVVEQANAQPASAAMATYSLISADVELVKTGVLSTDKTTITYTLTVTNHGPESAQDVSVTDAVPSKTQLISASSMQGSCSGTSTTTCSIGAMTNNQVVTITIVVKEVKQSGFISNTASVSSSTSDPNLTNNSSTVRIKAR
jgi:uncharacterized repeat protein (TIGR01451 family)